MDLGRRPAAAAAIRLHLLDEAARIRARRNRNPDLIEHVPPSYRAETPLPLVALLHPLGADGPTFEQMTGFSALANNKD
jgi:hypothetical protein